MAYADPENERAYQASYRDANREKRRADGREYRARTRAAGAPQWRDTLSPIDYERHLHRKRQKDRMRQAIKDGDMEYAEGGAAA